ncbi:MAG: formylglycine-generating enzyme family protein, partial [Thermoguttaceae bacterium]|nr:formylglycine-generating enzyme family protein [Thermoguttaceae bacterium]
MPDRFDPYHQWLGIPPEDQPPNHYRLLGVPLFEPDPNVIENAADQRMTHLRVFQAGKHGKLSQQLLNEVAAARVTLLNAERKAAYDARLREELASEVTGEGSESKAPEAGWPGIVEPGDVPASPLGARHKAKRAAPTPAALLGAAGALAVAILGVALWWALGRGERDPGAVAKSEPQPSAGAAKVPPPKLGEPTRSDVLPAKARIEGRLAEAAQEEAPEGEDIGAAPPLAVAPFDKKTAKRHQLLWSRYLGLPIEHDVDLGSGVKLTMVLIPPGEFMMGSSDAERQRALEDAKAVNDNWAIQRIPTEGPQHRVKITRPFYLGKYEVTQAQWLAVMGNNPSQFQAPANPVEQVNWEDVQSFLAKVNATGTRRTPSAQTGHAARDMKYALPTEAQWEYACRAGTTTTFSFGDDASQLDEYAWHRYNSGRQPQPVGRQRPNAWGLYDMHGNVWEWCANWFDEAYYANSPTDDPPGPGT